MVCPDNLPEPVDRRAAARWQDRGEAWQSVGMCLWCCGVCVCGERGREGWELAAEADSMSLRTAATAPRGFTAAAGTTHRQGRRNCGCTAGHCTSMPQSVARVISASGLGRGTPASAGRVTGSSCRLCSRICHLTPVLLSSSSLKNRNKQWYHLNKTRA